MADRKSDFALPTLDDLFSTQEERDDTRLEKIRDIPLDLSILQKRSVYRYKLDKDEFILRATSGIENQLLRKNDYIQFEITKAEVDFNDSRKMKMANAQKQVEDSDTHTITYEPKTL